MAQAARAIKTRSFRPPFSSFLPLTLTSSPLSPHAGNANIYASSTPNPVVSHLTGSAGGIYGNAGYCNDSGGGSKTCADSEGGAGTAAFRDAAVVEEGTVEIWEGTVVRVETVEGEEGEGDHSCSSLQTTS